MAKAKYNWEELKQEFFNSDIVEATTFIRGKLGGDERVVNSYIESKIVGWTNAKREWIKNRNAEIQRQLDQKKMESLEVKVETLLSIKKRLIKLDSKYIDILERMLIPNPKKPLTKNDHAFFNYYSDSIKDIYKRVQIELGLPTSVSQLQGKEEKPLYFKDLVEKAEKILGKDALK